MLHLTSVEFRAAASPVLMERGCVNVIGLDAVKQEAGSRWPRVREGVYARMETLLRQKLGPTDFFARMDEDSYLVTMPSTDPEDVNVVCLRVAYDLYSSFLGQCDIGHIHVSTASNAGENMFALTPLPAERIIVLAEKADIRDFNLPQNLQKTGAGWLSPAPADRAVTFASDASILAPKSSTLIVEHHYYPVWCAPAGVITKYVCEPKSILTAEASRKRLTIPQLSAKERIQVELSCLHAGIVRLAEHIQKDNQFLLGIMISFDVLGSPAGRMEFLSSCRNLSSEHRRHLTFTLTEVPPGVAHTRLNDLINTLRPFARSVSATVPPGQRDYFAYQGIGLRAIGIAKREFASGQDIRNEDIAHLTRAAQSMKLATFIHDIKKIDELKAARAANIQFLSGPAVGPPCDEPRGMSCLPWEDILSYKILA